MDWRRLERWVTTALYAAGGVALAIVLTKNLAPDGSWLRRLAQYATVHLTELGGVSEGMLVVIILLILGGNRTMVSIFAGIDRYREWKGRDERLKAEGRAAGRVEGQAEGRVQGRAEAVADLRARLEARGLNPDDFLPPEPPATDANPPTGNNGAGA